MSVSMIRVRMTSSSPHPGVFERPPYDLEAPSGLAVHVAGECVAAGRHDGPSPRHGDDRADAHGPAEADLGLERRLR
jgi:hypothetical protein